MTHLRRYLEKTGALAPEHLDAALRRQQIYGGSLDTVLLELGLVDPQTLGELLAQACNLETVPPELLDNGLDRPWDQVPEELIEIGWAVPLARTEDGLIVGVHPDLPDERLGALYRHVKGVRPMVTPECAIEKLTAERTASVVPQRYATLCASYVSALRRRPSVSDVGFPMIPGLAPSEDTAVGAPPRRPASRIDLDEDTRPRARADAAASAVAEPVASGIPAYIGHDEAESFGPRSGHTDVIVLQEPVRAPPVRFTQRGTMISTAQRLEARFEEAQVQRKVASARELLEQASTRDAAIDALVRAVMVITPRVGLFRVKAEALHGMAAPRSALPDLAGAVVPTPAGSELAAALEDGSWVGSTTDPALQSALQLQLPIPCLLVRVDVVGRPVLVLYADHGGRDLLPPEIHLIESLCVTASETFENILKAKRTAVPAPSRAAASSATDADEPASNPEAGPKDTGPSPPPAFGTTTPKGWGPAPAAAREALTEPPGEETDAAGRTRDTQLDGSPTPAHQGNDKRAPLLTITAGSVPPPPIPPPPPMGEEADGETPTESLPPDTLTGLPPPPQPAAPRFIPPPLDERENSGIISLAAPIDQPTVRGRIALEDEDWSSRSQEWHSEDQQRDIDELIESLMRGEGDIEQLQSFGSAGMARVAALFPGPLEVLRRDLRALPPPSAHGPLIRTVLRLGPPIVPYLLDLFPHPDPDVRFYAAFVFQELRDPRCMLPLSRLAFDGSGDVRVISMRVLETYSRHPDFADAVSTVREELGSKNRNRQLHAARSVGTLRDTEAIPALIELLSSKDRFIQEASLESLCSITGQQHGLKPHRWRAWYEEHGHQHRIEWVITSLEHRDLPVRRWAHDELIRVTGHRIPFSPLGDKKSREVAASAWTDWWDTVGRQRFNADGR